MCQCSYKTTAAIQIQSQINSTRYVQKNSKNVKNVIFCKLQKIASTKNIILLELKSYKPSKMKTCKSQYYKWGGDLKFTVLSVDIFFCCLHLNALKNLKMY